ncbi:ribulose-phosphate 3-epimerase [Candidatus Daviesbacteria bacterium]|nr:ribulose-phosphate 3-epimerase [Candidatus Daviesbacteria bacterium]
MIQIIPAILANTPQDYKRDIEKINNSASFKKGWVHIDFMDNKFVPNKSVDPSVIKLYPTHLKKEAHLMVEHPSYPWAGDLVGLGFDRVIIHVESGDDKHLEDCLAYLEDHNIETGLAINPQTPLDKLKPHLDNIDLILIMGVIPGFQSQPFQESTFARVKRASSMFNMVSVDGGVKDINAKQLALSGARILVSGSFILNGNIDENVEKIWESIKSP